jgi:hypothetical protein
MDVALPLIVHQVLELLLQTLVRFDVVRRVRQDDVPVFVESHSILRPRQIFRRKPKIERVFCHLLKSESGCDRRRAGRERHTIELSDKRDVSHRIRPVIRAEIEIIDRERLLKHSRVRAFGNGKKDRINMAHVIASDLIGAVCKSVRMMFVR